MKKLFFLVVLFSQLPFLAGAKNCIKVGFFGDPLFMKTAELMLSDVYRDAGTCLEPIQLPIKRAESSLLNHSIDAMAYWIQNDNLKLNNVVIALDTPMFETQSYLVYDSTRYGNKPALEDFRDLLIGHHLGDSHSLAEIEKIGAQSVSTNDWHTWVKLIDDGRMDGYMIQGLAAEDLRAKNILKPRFKFIKLDKLVANHVIRIERSDLAPKLNTALIKAISTENLINRYQKDLALQAKPVQ